MGYYRKAQAHRLQYHHREPLGIRRQIEKIQLTHLAHYIRGKPKKLHVMGDPALGRDFVQPVSFRPGVTVNSGVQVSSQAAFLLTSLSSTPSMNFTPAMTSASCWKPRSRRHRFCALIAS